MTKKTLSKILYKIKNVDGGRIEAFTRFGPIGEDFHEIFSVSEFSVYDRDNLVVGQEFYVHHFREIKDTGAVITRWEMEL